jgi:hypothetical protein
VRVENALGNCFVSAPQIHGASPWKTSARPIVTITIVSTDAPSTGRITVRSSATPPANESASVRKNAPQNGIPLCSMSAQATKVENMAISPCAKLMTRVAR